MIYFLINVILSSFIRIIKIPFRIFDQYLGSLIIFHLLDRRVLSKFNYMHRTLYDICEFLHSI